MKTKNKTLAISSGCNEINFRLPKSWSELTQKQLKTVCVFLTAYPSLTALVKITCYFANISIVENLHNGYSRCKVFTNKGCYFLKISSVEMALLTDAMEWVLSPGDTPVMLKIGGKTSINPLLQGVPFRTYLALENYYQGYLLSNNEKAIEEMANIIFGAEEKNFVMTNLEQYEVFAIVLWFTQIKSLFSKTFTNLFRSAGGGLSSASMLESMNAEIRALTGGDITKEEDVLSSDCWRALTELDAKAKEAEEFKKSMKK